MKLATALARISPPPVMRQFAYEDEGAAHYLEHRMSREECPYDRDTQPLQWNMWVFGRDMAQSELETMISGNVKYCNVSEPENIKSMSLDEALRSGLWRPRHLGASRLSGCA